MKIELGKLVSNTTIIKDGVDLKKRFFKVLDEHPFANLWSKAAKKVIAGELCDEVMKDSITNKDKECCGRWREKIVFKNAEESSKGTPG